MEIHKIAAWSVLAAASLGAAIPAPAQIAGSPASYNARTIRVSGVGEFRAQPDLASVNFAVETTAATAEEAGASNADRMTRVIEALMAAGVARSEIRTSGYSLYPEYAQDSRPGGELEPPRIRGYRARNQVTARTRDLAEVGTLIDAGLAAGANSLAGVGFELENSDAAEAEALSRAVADARRAAQTMADALGVTLGPVLDASTDSQPIRPMYRGDVVQMEMARAAPTPIEPGEQTVTASASLVFSIEP